MPPLLIERLQNYLIAEGLGRKPEIAGAAVPIHLEPQDGVPAPGEGDPTAQHDDLVVGIWQVPGVVTAKHEGFMRNVGFQFQLFARRSYIAHEYERGLYERLHDEFGWVMQGVHVMESRQYSDLALIDADANGYLYGTQYLFHVWADVV